MGIIQTKDLSFVLKTEFFLRYNLGQDLQNPHPAYWYHNDPPPTLISQGKKNDPVRLQSLFFGGGGVFVIIIASALKGFILKLDMATSIFGSIVIQDCS